MKEQLAVVTGSCGTIGQQIVATLVQAGFYVAATDIDSSRFSLCAQKGVQCFSMDVANISSIATAYQQIQESFALPVTILVNNAGIFYRHSVAHPDFAEQVCRIINVNLLGCFYCTEIFGKQMMRNKAGRIINISSIAGIIGAGHASGYSAAKAGMIAATKSWARELAPFGIDVYAIAPGICKTSMSEESLSPQLERLIPVKQFGTAQDIAEIVQFLATCKTRYATGSVITLDGGISTGTVELTGG